MKINTDSERFRVGEPIKVKVTISNPGKNISTIPLRSESIDPGKVIEESVNISDLFDLQLPGTYRIVFNSRCWKTSVCS